MLPSEVLDKFIERCPAAVMVRATVERVWRPERLDEIFEAHRSRRKNARCCPSCSNEFTRTWCWSPTATSAL